MLLLDNFTHSDLHPGNIMIKFFRPTTRSVLKYMYNSVFKKGEHSDPLEDARNSVSNSIISRLRKLAALPPSTNGSPEPWIEALKQLDERGYQPELIFLDAGLVNTLSETNRKNFIDLFKAIASFDGYEAGRLMIERCKTPELVIDGETFCLKIQHLLLSVKSQTFSLSKIKVSDVLTNVLQNVRKHHVKMEADFVNTILSILLLEGIGRQLDPGLDLLKSSIPILRQLGRHMGTKGAIEEGVREGSLTVMLKIWIWMEARELVSMAVGEIDDLVRADMLTPNV
jgi:aarF domain-containing kinase